MKVSKKIRALILSVVVTMFFASSVVAFAKDLPASGGWTVNKNVSTTLTKKQQKAFNKIVKNLDGVSYNPVAVIGSQVVAGTNCAFLCQKTVVVPGATPSWVVMTAYEDLKGNVKLKGVKTIDIAKVKTYSKKSTIAASGAWQDMAPKKSGVAKKDKNVFNKALKTYKGKEKLKPIALLGTQVVAGTNYRFLCSSSDDNGDYLYVVTVYKNLKGTCKITSCKLFNLKKYVSK